MTTVDDGTRVEDLRSLRKIGVPLSSARVNFVGCVEDIRSYYTIHQHAGKVLRGGRRHLFVLNKAMFVLVASMWEAYCQDLVAEAVGAIVADAPEWKALPSPLVKMVSKELRSLDVDHAPWALAGEGWRSYLLDRMELVNRKIGIAFSSPRSDAVDRLFREHLGIVRISDEWATEEVECAEIRTRLDSYIERRNMIVHEYEPGSVVSKKDLKAFFTLVYGLTVTTDAIVDRMLVAVTGKSHWTHPDLLSPTTTGEAGYLAIRANRSSDARVGLQPTGSGRVGPS